MAFQPDQEYKAEIASYRLAEDNNGKPEIHIGVSQGSSAVIYKLKFVSKETKQRALEFALRFGADRAKLNNAAYLEQWGLGLIGRDCWIQTKAWEMDGKTGVFVSKISPKPFPPLASAVAAMFNSMTSLELTDDDMPPY